MIDNGRQCSKNSPSYYFRAVQVLAIAPIDYTSFEKLERIWQRSRLVNNWSRNSFW